jgi:hypothetical protein
MKTNIYTFAAIMTLALASTGANAQTWRPKNAGLPASFWAESVFGDGNMILAVSNSPSGQKIYYTPDSSTAFTGSVSTFGLYAGLQTGVVKAHGMHFVAGVGGVFKSSDNGVTWTITGPSSNQYTYALYAGGDTLYASMGNTTQLPYYSTDDGNTWTLIPGYTGSQIRKMLRYDGVLYAGGSSSFQYTTDMGTTWNTVSTPTVLSGQYINGLVVFQGAVYASCVNGVFRSADNGATWTNMTTTPMNCMAAVDTSLFCGSGTNGIYRSDMSATTWTNLSSGLSFYISTLHYTINDISSNNDYVIAAATNDPNSIYVIKLGDLGLSPTAATTGVSHGATHPITVEVIPNPANSEVIVKLSNNASDVKVIVTDPAGHVVKNIAAHGAEAKIDVRNVPSGMYFVQITGEGQRNTKKLEIIH